MSATWYCEDCAADHLGDCPLPDLETRIRDAIGFIPTDRLDAAGVLIEKLVRLLRDGERPNLTLL